jgi:hypothetical protein
VDFDEAHEKEDLFTCYRKCLERGCDDEDLALCVFDPTDIDSSIPSDLDYADFFEASTVKHFIQPWEDIKWKYGFEMVLDELRALHVAVVKIDLDKTMPLHKERFKAEVKGKWNHSKKSYGGGNDKKRGKAATLNSGPSRTTVKRKKKAKAIEFGKMPAQRESFLGLFARKTRNPPLREEKPDMLMRGKGFALDFYSQRPEGSPISLSLSSSPPTPSILTSNPLSRLCSCPARRFKI